MVQLQSRANQAIRKNDMVQVVSGKEEGKLGKVVSLLADKDRLNTLGENGKKAIKSALNWEMEFKQLENLILKIWEEKNVWYLRLFSRKFSAKK